MRRSPGQWDLLTAEIRGVKEREDLKGLPVLFLSHRKAAVGAARADLGGGDEIRSQCCDIRRSV